MLMLRDEMVRKHKYQTPIHVGAAGGIGTAHAAAAAFIMGADFVLTGSINQCTVEAGTSDTTKSILQDIGVRDTTYAPAGDMFEMGARVQVVRKGLFFPARANRLYELYQRHNSLEEIDMKTREQIQEKYFKRSFADVWEETRRYYLRTGAEWIHDIENKPKQKMALIFKWYFVHTTRLAQSGSEDQRVDYQIHCGPALGAFNQWVRGTPLQSWQERHVADIGVQIMNGAAQLLNDRYRTLLHGGAR
jgi:trans-AT polyketide synthase/acyltransferase/oxidoreductase domain-containing protein